MFTLLKHSVVFQNQFTLLLFALNFSKNVCAEFLFFRFTGEQCTEDVKECESEPCQNNGTCNETGIYNRYNCICTPEYEGIHCEREKEGKFLSFSNGYFILK